jgi:uncharacterized membrane protein YeaQ/YmgE (transglycosylase-associated protein family)
MALWVLIVWLIVGAVIGFLAKNWIAGSSPFGQAGDIILGAAGGVVGGYLLALLGATGTAGIIASIIVAAIAGLLLVWLSRKLKKV